MPREEHTEERVEYRVRLMGNTGGASDSVRPARGPADARRIIAESRSHFEWHRIETRTVQVGPWEPVDPQEGRADA